MPWRVAPVHVVTDDEVVSRPEFLGVAVSLLEAGGPDLAFHLRAPGCAGRVVFQRAVALAPVARRAGATLLVNDRVDVALAARVDGVQLGARSLSPLDARRLLGPDALLGASVHSFVEAECTAGADFLLAGTLFETPSHPGRRAAGPALVRALVAFGLPVIGIGGVTAARAGTVRRAGAAGVAVLRAVWDSGSPAAALNEVIEACKKLD